MCLFLFWLIWLWMYSCSLCYKFFSLLEAFLSFCALKFDSFLILVCVCGRGLGYFLKSFCFHLIRSDSHKNLNLALGSVSMHSVSVSLWATINFSYSAFGPCVSDIASSSPSCHTASTHLIMPPVSIVHRYRHVFNATSNIGTVLLNIGSISSSNYVQGFTIVCRLWVRPSFSCSFLYILFV